MMRYGTVCSGIEAASVALEPLDWQPAWFAEIERFPSSVLAHHWPNVPNLGDMTTIADRVLAGEVEAPDALIGGTPCQAFSVAGLRNSLADVRGQLTLEFVRLANAIDRVRRDSGKPECVVWWENVPGVLNTPDNAFGCFIGALAGCDAALVHPQGCGWPDAGLVAGPVRTVVWRVLDAQYFGLAQRRRRVFVVASADAWFDTAAVLFEFKGLRRDSAPSREAQESPANTIAGGARKRGGYSYDDVPAVSLPLMSKAQPMDFELQTLIAGTLQANGKAAGSATQQDAESGLLVACSVSGDIAHTLNSANGGKNSSEDGTGRGVPIIAFTAKDHRGDASLDLAPTLRAGGFSNSHANAGVMPAIAFHGSQDPDVSGDVTHPVGRNQGQETCVAYTTKLHNTASNQAGKLYEEYAPSLDRSSPPPALITPYQVRRLMPVECERLQGFPDNHTQIPTRRANVRAVVDGDGVRLIDGTVWVMAADGPRYKAIGNSMPVNVMRWIGERVSAHAKPARRNHRK
ncbi:DNA cytosine methyltransferase [Chitinimonas sp.]|uniref:DNA cytosine methyltransferase n=1 Tax=Chitinimonas sp. TaxID=1934313 RepID=UPI0035B43CB4